MPHTINESKKLNNNQPIHNNAELLASKVKMFMHVTMAKQVKDFDTSMLGEQANLDLIAASQEAEQAIDYAFDLIQGYIDSSKK